MLERRLDRGLANLDDMMVGLQTIHEQSDRLARLIDGLLDISRLQAKKFTLDVCRTDLVSLTRSVMCIMKPLLGERHVDLSAPEALWADIDPLRVEQIITNLLTNATKFTIGPQPIELALCSEGETALITVRDFGLGIPLEAREHLFARFHQAHSAKHHGGMGLGLYISREIAVAHGGSLEAQHPLDGGALFVLRLPIAGIPPRPA
jgi:signal transduction histidine kinase